MSDQYVGEIRLFAGNYAPEGWLLCDGSLLPTKGYEMLFALIGNTYGGDGQTTFKLPDLRGRIPIHAGTNPHTGTRFPIGEMGGLESVTLRESEMPMHTHIVNISSEEGTSSTPSGHYFADSNVNQYSTKEADGKLSAQAVVPIGGSQPHNNMMPYAVLTYIIATQGIYPTPN